MKPSSSLSYLLILSLALIAPHTYAESCPWYRDWFSLCEAADVAGEKVARATVKASENVQMAINPFVQMLFWYHSGDATQHEQARKFILGSFGLKDPTVVPQFQISVFLDFADQSEQDSVIHIALLRNAIRLNDKQLAEAVTAGERSDMNFIPVMRGLAKPIDVASYEADVAAIRAALRPRAQAVSKAVFDIASTCAARMEDYSFDACAGNSVTAPLTEAIMLLIDKKAQLYGAKPTANFPWRGEKFLTLLIPSAELQRHRGLKITYTIHPVDNLEAPLPEFMNNPDEVSVDAMMNRSPLASTARVPVGPYHYTRIELQM